MGYRETLGLSSAEFETVEEHLERREYRGLSYRSLPRARAGLEKGTVLVADRVVRGFPKVPRTLVLAEGVPRQFDGRVVVEEKLDGYNVRVALVEDELLAFTRSGIVCPFTTAKVRRWLDRAFFEAHPDRVLCGEVVGRESPYTTHDYPDVDSLAFRAFGVRALGSGDPLPVEKRRALCEAFDVPQVRLFGTFERGRAADEVHGIVRELDAAGREGVVMKSPDATTQLKYTTSAANQGDLAFAFSLPFDYGRDFVFRRLIREAFQAVERGESPEAVEARAHALGESILEPMVDTVERVAAGETVGEVHTVRGEPAVVEALLEHLRDQGLRVDVEADRTEAGERVVTFVKVMRSTTDRARAYLDGQIVRE